MASPFAALLRAAGSDPSVADAVAHAYATLDAPERDRLHQTVLCDALEIGIAPEPILAIFIAVEEDGERAARLARSIARDAAHRAWRWREGERGGVVLERTLWPGAAQVLGLAWDEGALRVCAEPRADEAVLARVKHELGVPALADSVAPDEALDEMAARLWRWRRAGGELPEALGALAHWFAIRAS